MTGPDRRASSRPLHDALVRLVEGRQHAPFDLLGRCPASGSGDTLRVFVPGAEAVRVSEGPALAPTAIAGIFEYRGPLDEVPRHYRLSCSNAAGDRWTVLDPYSFTGGVAASDAYYFNEGTHLHLYDVLGAHVDTVDGIRGVRFAVWAPNAERVSVIGDFNFWDGRRHPMQSQGASGLWWLFVPEIDAGTFYKFEIRCRLDGSVRVKSDPFARACELRPGTASVVFDSDHAWADDAWMARRRGTAPLEQPISIYEVHLGSWQRRPDGRFNDYRTLARALADYVSELGFSHVELLPVSEHPFDGSWGYQTLGYFAPTSRFGSPDDFRWFVDHLHQRGIGVLLDWVPAHFPRDEHGLARFDGSALYEHGDPRLSEHPDWGTLIFNYGRNEVGNFLTANALFWLREFHIDGLRVDAVASMLYLDYSRDPGEWLPNRHGGRENLEAVRWLRALNETTHRECPGTLMIAEESTAWPQVTGLTSHGGLGFTLKWNMGWMHDTLSYFRHDPIYRAFHHDQLTFSMLYAFSENYTLPLSHDEVVHGKRSLLEKMPGDRWQQFANLRLLLAYLFTHPGKKLLFMGGEFGQTREWNHDAELDWGLLGEAPHRRLQHLVGVLNELYRSEPALARDHDPDTFEWIDCHDRASSVLSFLRRAGDQHCIVVLNGTPTPRPGYRVGAPCAGTYRIVLDTDDPEFGGSGYVTRRAVVAAADPWQGRPASLALDLPPLAAVLLTPERIA